MLLFIHCESAVAFGVSLLCSHMKLSVYDIIVLIGRATAQQ